MGALKILQVVGGGVIEKIVCGPIEMVHQQLNHYNARQDLAHEQKLRQEDARFQQELALENRKRNAEIDALIEEGEIARRKKIIETVENYRKTMAECTVSIGNSLGAMTIELRARATDLLMEKQIQYKKLQDDATEHAMNQLEIIAKKFPEGSKANDMMTESVINQLNNIVETSRKFMETIDADFSKMMESINRITERAIDNANQYISPTFAKNISGKTNQGLLD